MNRRADIRQPISLRASFKTVRGLVCEYTTSLAKGGCSVRSPVAVEPGTVFVMTLALEGSTRRSLEIEGKVVHSSPRKDGAFDVGIQYVHSSPPRRVATMRFLDEVFAEQLANRKHARIPVNLVAENAQDSDQKFLVRDLSRGGMGLRLPAGRTLPGSAALGGRVELSIWHDGDEPFSFGASIVRLEAAEPPKQAVIGLCFDELSDANQRMIDALLYLHRPQAIQIRFGLPTEK